MRGVIKGNDNDESCHSFYLHFAHLLFSWILISPSSPSWPNCYWFIQQVIGDATPDASKLMKREGVRSVPSFHYFKSGEKVEVVNGANAEAIEAAIKKHA
mmetsp:Transcript_23559/g.51027  ORF Transcript_23559/g.51027 Transcript_23559/m.51027 type:complete len:100 (+) Transcript_23559:112-411(+)